MIGVPVDDDALGYVIATSLIVEAGSNAALVTCRIYHYDPYFERGVEWARGMVTVPAGTYVTISIVGSDWDVRAQGDEIQTECRSSQDATYNYAEMSAIKVEDLLIS